MKYYLHEKKWGKYEHVIAVKNNKIVYMICLDHDRDKVNFHDFGFGNRIFDTFVREGYDRITRDEYDNWIAEKAFIEAI